jgi:sugar transferase (PEP-CTERM/EpsH1 system associated)
LLSRHGDVSVLSLVHGDEEASHRGALSPWASSVRTVRVTRARNLIRSAIMLPTPMPMTHTMLDAPGLLEAVTLEVKERRPDVVLAYCSGMARLALSPALRNIPTVLDMVDVDSAKWRELARASHPPLSWIYRREAATLRTFEACAVSHAKATMVVTPKERDTLQEIAPRARIEVVSNGIEVGTWRPRPETRASDSSRVVFCGVMDYTPNEQAAVLLAREVWPLVRRRHPAATLALVGSHPSHAVRALEDAAHGIVVTGAVPDVRPYLWEAALAVAPLRTARGIQNKVLEAVAAGLPTVVTPNVFASLPMSVRPACVAADTAPEIANGISALLLQSPEARRAFALRADLSSLSWEKQLSPVPALLADAMNLGTEASDIVQ